jgi:hypothetical protein
MHSCCGPAGAKFNVTNHKVASIGAAGGAQVFFGPVEALISGLGGQALGLTLLQDGGDALDFANEERTHYGGLAHVTYTLGKAKLGLQYGINYADRTDNDQTVINVIEIAALPVVYTTPSTNADL